MKTARELAAELERPPKPTRANATGDVVLGGKLRTLRERAGLTLAQVAGALGMQRTNLNVMELGGHMHAGDES